MTKKQKEKARNGKESERMRMLTLVMNLLQEKHFTTILSLDKQERLVSGDFQALLIEHDYLGKQPQAALTHPPRRDYLGKQECEDDLPHKNLKNLC
ncbi:hypothetical protein V6N13_114011 [Hibiscus sabdariffa]